MLLFVLLGIAGMTAFLRHVQLPARIQPYRLAVVFGWGVLSSLMIAGHFNQFGFAPGAMLGAVAAFCGYHHRAVLRQLGCWMRRHPVRTSLGLFALSFWFGSYEYKTLVTNSIITVGLNLIVPVGILALLFGTVGRPLIKPFAPVWRLVAGNKSKQKKE